MSKLDPTGESLESILASIRRSLAEQSTDVLADDAAPQSASVDPLGAVVPGEDAPPRFIGNGGPPAPHQPDVRQPAEAPLLPAFPVPSDRAFAGLDNPPPPASISAALARRDESSPPPAASTAPASSPAEEAPKDPLWFLVRGQNNKDGIPAPKPAAAAAQPAPAQVAPAPIPPAQAAPAQPAAPVAAAPKPALTEHALKEIVRGPLPPFFGSSPEAAKVEVSPAPPAAQFPLPGAAAMPPPPASAARPAELEPQRNAAPVPGSALPIGAGPLGGPASAAARDALPNGRASPSVAGPSATDSAAPPVASPPMSPAAAGTSQLQGLEAMVAELLRPMLRQWLNENMPRLVSAALKVEAETLARRDPKKP